MLLEPLYIPPRVCLWCDGHYWAWASSSRKFCSKQCQSAASNARRRLRSPYVPVVLAATRCDECGVTFQPSRRGQRWCGQRCVSRGHARLRKKGPFPGACAHCGESFVSARPTRFCGSSCQERAAYLAAVPPRVCVECGDPYRRRGRGERCTPCGRAYRAREYRARHKERSYRKVTKTRLVCRLSDRPKSRSFVAGPCADCGVVFVGLASLGVRYCSPVCAKRASRDAHRLKRRAASAGGERIYRRKVFERDGWTCRICRKPVDREAQVPHPKAPTIDHVVPLALGGEHVFHNVQTAHFICNSRKGANVTQLAFAA